MLDIFGRYVSKICSRYVSNICARYVPNICATYICQIYMFQGASIMIVNLALKPPLILLRRSRGYNPLTHSTLSVKQRKFDLKWGSGGEFMI